MPAEVGEWEPNALMETSTCVSSFIQLLATTEPGTSFLLTWEMRTARKFQKGGAGGLGRLDLGHEGHPTGSGWEMKARGQARGL